jgi:hypothetical protein
MARQTQAYRDKKATQQRLHPEVFKSIRRQYYIRLKTERPWAYQCKLAQVASRKLGLPCDLTIAWAKRHWVENGKLRLRDSTKGYLVSNCMFKALESPS